MLTERLESMSHRGFLRLIRQNDGDIIVTIGAADDRGSFTSFSTIEFCTPFAGGGGSRRTYAALIQLAAAMAADNLDESQHGSRPPELNDDEQRQLVEWGEQCRRASEEFGNTQSTTEARTSLDAADKELRRIGVYYGGRAHNGRECYAKNLGDFDSISIWTGGEESWTAEELETIVRHKRCVDAYQMVAPPAELREINQACQPATDEGE